MAAKRNKNTSTSKTTRVCGKRTLDKMTILSSPNQSNKKKARPTRHSDEKDMLNDSIKFLKLFYEKEVSSYTPGVSSAFLSSFAEVSKVPFLRFCDMLLTSFMQRTNPEKALAKLKVSSRRKVCGHIFSADEVAFSCRTCQADITCVICQTCFTNSNHTGHEVYFHRTTAGGCCDCGDHEAWDRNGFCTSHPGHSSKINDAHAENLKRLPKDIHVFAPTLLDSIIQQLFDTCCRVKEAFTLAQVIERVYVPPSEDEETKASDESSLKLEVSSDATDSSKLFLVRLHNDDVHVLAEVVSAVREAANCSRLAAGRLVSECDASGSVNVKEGTLQECLKVVFVLKKANLNVSIMPKEFSVVIMNRMEELLKWIHNLCRISDGLNSLIAQHMYHEREDCQFIPQSVDLNNHQITISEFLKLSSKYINKSLIEVIQKGMDSSKTIKQWISERSKHQHTLKEYVELSDFNDLSTKRKIITTFDELWHSKPCSLLDMIVEMDCKFRKSISKVIHPLLRDLILIPGFKQKMIYSFISAYQSNTLANMQGLGSPNDSMFDFAVQLFTVPSLVQQATLDIPEKDPKNLLNVLLSALNYILQSALEKQKDDSKTDGYTTIDPASSSISHQRYKHCFDNLDYALNIEGMSKKLLTAESLFNQWLTCLSYVQNADPQLRLGVGENHVEYESDTWFPTFNLSIRIHSIFPILFSGVEEMDKNECRIIFQTMLKMIQNMKSKYNSCQDEKQVNLINCLLEKKSDNSFQVIKYDVSNSHCSFHIPLHRCFGALAKHRIFLCSKNPLSEMDDVLKWIGLNDVDTSTCLKLLELPLQNIVKSSQIKANMWRRNGEDNMLAQLFNYCSLPYCIHFRDVDLFLLQLGVLKLGGEWIVNMIVDKFQVFEYLFQLEKSKHTFESLASGLDPNQVLELMQECLRLIIGIGSMLPCSHGKDYDQEYLKDEVIHQLCADDQTFSALSDCIVLPSGVEDVPTKDLEQVLKNVADYSPPTGLEPGKYALKASLRNAYNPYHLHLGNEAHENARTRIAREQKQTCYNASPIPQTSSPLSIFLPVQDILLNQSTIVIIQSILSKLILRPTSTSESGINTEEDFFYHTSEGLITMTLHLLTYSIHAALRTKNNTTKFCELIQNNFGVATNNSLLKDILSLSVDIKISKVHKKTFTWILNHLKDMNDGIAHEISKFEIKQKQLQTLSTCSNALSPKERQKAARERALDLMAKHQASFAAILDKENILEDESKESSFENELNIEGTSCFIDHRCILCHESSNASELGYVAFVQKSSTLQTNFRPASSSTCLQEEGKKSRSQIRDCLIKMKCHGRDWTGAPTLEFNLNDDDSDDFGLTIVTNDVSEASFEGSNGFQTISIPMENIPSTGESDSDSDSESYTLNSNEEETYHSARIDKSPLTLSPCGLHLRSCQHLVHMQCLESYIRSLSEKADRGEDFEGMQAVDPDDVNTQFLCPLCKTLSNVIIPVVISSPSKEIIDKPVIKPSVWYDILTKPSIHKTWYRHKKNEISLSGLDVQMWTEYFEDAQWSPDFGGVPFVWLCCAYTLNCTLLMGELETNEEQDKNQKWSNLVQKEWKSMESLVHFTHVSFELLETRFMKLLNIIRRCCPLFHLNQQKITCQQITKMVDEYHDAVHRGLIVGLLAADPFTSFIITSVICKDEEVIKQLMPLFYVMEIILAIYNECFVVSVDHETFEQIFVDHPNRLQDSIDPQRPNRHVKINSQKHQTKESNKENALKEMKNMKTRVERSSSSRENNELLGMINIILKLEEEKTKDEKDLEIIRFKSVKKLRTSMENILKNGEMFCKKVRLYWACLKGQEEESNLEIVFPSFMDIFTSSPECWKVILLWCHQHHLIRRMKPFEEDHVVDDDGFYEMNVEDISSTFIGNMFSSPALTTLPNLIELPEQYDVLYSSVVGQECRVCKKVPSEPGICLICGEYLCCGNRCCKQQSVHGGSSLGECTKHALECNGGTGIVLLILQCRIALIGGGMTAYYPSPYVDSHGEEDPGLARGRPLRLDHGRYSFLNNLWRHQKIYTEVSRLRNHESDEHQLLALGYL